MVGYGYYVESGERSESLQNQIDLCKNFAKLYFKPRKTYNKDRTSYGLKHVVENWLKACDKLKMDIGAYNPCYVSNDAFIIAMQEMYYAGKRDYVGSPNYYFKFEYIGPKIYKLEYRAYTIPYDEFDWMKVFSVVPKRER